MKGRDGKGAPPADLLVCFPSRAHLTLMPKPICSPARPTESTKRHHHHHHHHFTRCNNRGGQASPLLWAKTKPMGSEIAEPTSPKVTCAGQIKVSRHKPSSCKNWQSVMEEIEMLHNNRRNKKKPSWVESFGFKKDILQFLTCLRGLRFNLRCFGSFHESDVISDDEEDEEEEDQENHVGMEGSGASKTIFSKWFMILQENQNNGFSKEEKEVSCDEGSVVTSSAPPPPNALLLMRCRSAPAKSWLEEKEREEVEAKKAKLVLEEEKKKESLALKSNIAPNFFRVSSDIAKETWVVGGMKDPLSRSRSCKR